MAAVIRLEREANIAYPRSSLQRVCHLSFRGKSLLTFKAHEVKNLVALSRRSPQHVGEAKGRSWWVYKRDIYSTAEKSLEPDEVLALIEEKENKRKLKIARAKSVAAMAEGLDRTGQRQPIPREVKVAVWQRDKGACVQCGSNANLEYDHIVPLAMGGSNTERNLQLLCEGCNREKGPSL